MKKNMRFCAGVCASSLVALLHSEAALAAADEAVVEDSNVIIVTATRSPIELKDAPATVTVIDSEQIADELATDVRDIVRFEPGVTVRRAPARFGAALGTTGRAGNEDFNIRGIGGNRVLIQVDGIRTPQGFSFGAQEVGRGGSTDVGLVKSIEILRGPASALYGSDGLSGAVSFTTSDPSDLLEGSDFGGFGRAQYSSADEEFSETLAVAGRLGNISAMLAYSRRDFQELDNQGTIDTEDATRTTPNPQDGESNAFLGKLVWESGSHKLRLTGEYLEREVFSDILSGRGPVFLFGPDPSWNVDSLTALDTTERTRVSLDWTYDAGSDSAGFINYAHLAAYWQNGKDRQFADEDRSPAGATPRPDRERLNTFDNEVYGANAELRSGFETGSISHRIAFGGDISWTRQEGLRDGVVPPFGEVFPSRAFPVTDFTLGGVFLGDEISFGDGAVTIFPALRFDFYDLDPTDDPLLPTFTAAGQDGSELSPKLGIVAKLTEEVRLFGNYAHGFRAPTPSQVNNFFENLAFGYTSAPNPDLRPESSESVEGGIRYATDEIFLSLTGFYADYDDFISQEDVSGSGTAVDPTVFQFVNLSSAKVHGFEVKATYEAESGFRARFALAYADGEEQTLGGETIPLQSIDPLNAVLGVGYRDPGNRFGGELIATYNARKEANEAGTCTNRGIPTACFRPDEFLILDATAFYRINDNFSIRAGLFNITNETYAYWNDVRGLSDTSTITEAFTQPGRNFSVSLSASF
ncbi:hemoglobin/transferrin/lactoferrin receptor protein [Parasphingorhabdus marina DSM 22363]|uniref:Hemoglobin/transferrin/lactoferrin receptor protein n=1 Tax=Parasphingorhabdus marina DSM 22363 TaxID=1123272 RepID=A0A1N6G8J3_9SPHN|nr:TonB-dependent hemoglobin/transferrin/lactoferrin family receptor [Parasphingorhabdus marina]SIO03866.1 hemoglobin/transferrin/lactoferrin receptor protein [Parasphingorhabdus marina DSM 22363]